MPVDTRRKRIIDIIPKDKKTRSEVKEISDLETSMRKRMKETPAGRATLGLRSLSQDVVREYKKGRIKSGL